MKLGTKNIYHYFYQAIGPLKSITELSEDESEKMVSNISEKTSIHHTRLTEFPDYIPHRRKVEKIMRDQFIQSSGKPQREAPLYFILGDEVSYQDDNLGCRVLELDPKEIPEHQLSFTFCDSMIAYPFKPFFSPEGYNFPFEKKQFHGKTFHFDELNIILEKYGHPNDSKNHFLPFPGFIEVQLWCNYII